MKNSLIGCVIYLLAASCQSVGDDIPIPDTHHVDTLDVRFSDTIELAYSDKWWQVHQMQVIDTAYWGICTIEDELGFRTVLQEITRNGLMGRQIDPFKINKYRGGVNGYALHEDKIWILGLDRVIELDATFGKVVKEYMNLIPLGEGFIQMPDPMHRSFHVLGEEKYLVPIMLNANNLTSDFYTEVEDVLLIYEKGLPLKGMGGFPSVLREKIPISTTLLITRLYDNHLYVYRYPNAFLEKFTLDGKRVGDIPIPELSFFEENLQPIPDSLRQADAPSFDFLKEVRKYNSEHLLDFSLDSSGFQFIWKSFDQDSKVTLHLLRYDSDRNKKWYVNLGSFHKGTGVIHNHADGLSDTVTIISRNSDREYFLVRKKIDKL